MTRSGPLHPPCQGNPTAPASKAINARAEIAQDRDINSAWLDTWVARVNQIHVNLHNSACTTIARLMAGARSLHGRNMRPYAVFP